MDGDVKISKTAIKKLIANMTETVIKSDEFAKDSSKGYPYALGFAQGELKSAIRELSFLIKDK